MQSRRTLRRLSESLRQTLTRAMPESRAWEWFFRLVTARAEGRRPPRPRTSDTASAAVVEAVNILWAADHAASVEKALADPATIGWMHQYWVSADKAGVAAKLRQKVGETIDGADLIATTSVYSSRSQVRFLLQHALARVWRAGPEAARELGWEYVDERDAGGGTRSAAEISVIDPACGCGHFLIEAFRVLVTMSQREHPCESVASICREVLARGLFGVDIDPRAVRVARWAVSHAAYELCGNRLSPGNITLARGLGSLKKPGGRSRIDTILSRRFTVVATNPPFVGYRKLSPSLKAAIATLAPATSGDLAAAFISRGLSMLECGGGGGSGGVLAIVTPAAWLSSTPALPLRRQVLSSGRPRVVATLGQRIFETAPLIYAALTVIQANDEDGPVVMVNAAGDANLHTAPRRRIPIARILHDPVLSFSPAAAVLPVAASTRLARTGDFFEFFDGVWAGDTERDTRDAANVEPADPQWMPVSARHGARRWYSPNTRVIRASLGRAWMHLPHRLGCLEYSRVAGGRLAARMVFDPTVAAAGVVSMALRPGMEDRRADVLAVFNSRAGTLWLRALVSGLNFNSGYAARVPIPSDGLPEHVRQLAWEAVEVKRTLVNDDDPERRQRLDWLEAEIDREVAVAMGLTETDLRDIARRPERSRVQVH